MPNSDPAHSGFRCTGCGPESFEVATCFEPRLQIRSRSMRLGHLGGWSGKSQKKRDPESGFQDSHHVRLTVGGWRLCTAAEFRAEVQCGEYVIHPHCANTLQMKSKNEKKKKKKKKQNKNILLDPCPEFPASARKMRPALVPMSFLPSSESSNGPKKKEAKYYASALLCRYLRRCWRPRLGHPC